MVKVEQLYKPLILIVEDDEDTALLNKRMLTRRGYDVHVASNAFEARALASELKPDLFVLDIVLPDGDGLTLCNEFRERSDAPILFLTGKKSTEDRIAGLSEGGDYYLTKPYDADEFLAIINRLVQRTQQVNKKISEASIITRGSLTLNIPLRSALVGEEDVGLSSTQFALLLHLVQNEDMVQTSEELFQSVWNTPMGGNSGALRAQMARLKKRLGEDDTDDFSIQYVHGKGYKFTMT